jgi:phospholipase/lecithinase/hemolysin
MVKKCDCQRFLIALFLLWIVSPVSAGPFTNVFFFGDSTTDTGNVCVLTPTADECSAPYFGNRASNGPVWADYFATSLGLSAKAALSPASAPPLLLPSGGTNFAVGGAQTVNLALSTPSQIGLYLNPSFFGAVDPNALYSIWIGGNDIRDIVKAGLSTPVAQALVAQAVENVILGIEVLRDHGAQNFLLALLPDTGISADFSDAQSALARQLTLSYNALLGNEAKSVLAGENLTLFDVFSLIEGIVNSGLFEVETPCLKDPACASNPTGPIADRFLLFDDIHATTKIHSLIAAAATTASTIPEPSTLALLTIGILGLLTRRCLIGC